MFAVIIGIPVHFFGECKNVNVLSRSTSFLDVSVLLFGLISTSEKSSFSSLSILILFWNSFDYIKFFIKLIHKTFFVTIIS